MARIREGGPTQRATATLALVVVLDTVPCSTKEQRISSLEERKSAQIETTNKKEIEKGAFTLRPLHVETAYKTKNKELRRGVHTGPLILLAYFLAKILQS